MGVFFRPPLLANRGDEPSLLVSELLFLAGDACIFSGEAIVSAEGEVLLFTGGVSILSTGGEAFLLTLGDTLLFTGRTTRGSSSLKKGDGSGLGMLVVVSWKS